MNVISEYGLQVICHETKRKKRRKKCILPRRTGGLDAMCPTETGGGTNGKGKATPPPFAVEFAVLPRTKKKKKNAMFQLIEARQTRYSTSPQSTGCSASPAEGSK